MERLAIGGDLVIGYTKFRSATAAAGILAMLSRSVGVTSELFYQVERQELGTFENHINTFGLAVGIAAFVF